MFVLLRLGLICALLTVSPASPALANDSAAEKAAGGLELVENENVAMESEDLTISPTRIDVAYVFRNDGDEDETLTVAFPLPAIEGYGVSMQPVDLPFPGETNFVGFRIEVDGETVEPELEERAFLGESDVTETLRGYGLALNPIGEGLASGLQALNAADYAALEKDGLVTERDMGEALWRYEAKFHFEQTFPAGQTVSIAHSYRPVRGLTFLAKTSFEEPGYLDAYCIDTGTRKAFESLIRKASAAAVKADPAGNAALTTAPLDGLAQSVVVPYILTTANNWSGPIGRFRLTIDKGSPGNVVSLCQDGLDKTGPTTFVFTAQDYVPERDLAVLFGGVDMEALGSE